MLELKNNIKNISRVEINDEESPIYHCYFYFNDNLEEQDKINTFDKILTAVGFLEAELKEDCNNYVSINVLAELNEDGELIRLPIQTSQFIPLD